MKSINLVVRKSEISKLFPNGFQLLMEDDVSIIDVIKSADREIRRKIDRFPISNFTSLLQMVYHQKEDRFYRQVAIQAYTKTSQFLNIRENPRTALPNGTTIILIPEGGCSTDWEEIVK